MKKVRKSPGRPLGSIETDVRNHMFQVRLSTSERAKIRAAARRVGLTISAWARMTLLRQAKRRNA